MPNSNTPFQNRTLNYAHRGFTRDAPENSMAAFAAAIELGADGIELDVRVCASGEVVVFHDPDLKRMTGHEGRIKELSLRDLRQFHFWHQGKLTDQSIPTLQEVIELIDCSVLLNVEIKADGLPRYHDIEKKVVDLLKQFNVLDSTIISSFNPLMVRRFRKIDPASLSGLLIDKKILAISELYFIQLFRERAIHIQGEILQRHLFNQIKRRNLGCFVWTVNSPDKMNQLIDWGVHGIITDKPDLLRKLQKEIMND